mgnify:FL=1
MSLVSIIMPYYKKKFYVEDSIKSILSQSYQNFEIILINDEAGVQNNEFLKKIQDLDPRIKLIVNEKNLGAGESRNKAITYAKGDYIAFCDCDDLWKKTKLENQLKFMSNYKVDFSFTGFEIIDVKGKIIGSRKAEKIIDYNELKRSCDIGLSTVILKKKFFENKKFQFANLKTKEDYVLWIKLAENKVRMFGLDEPLGSWRKSKESLSSSTLQKLSDGYKVYRIYLKYNVIKSLVYLFILSINFLLKK